MTDELSGKILVVDDNEEILLAAKLLLTRHGPQVVTLQDPEQIPTLLGDQSFDVILLDMNFTKDVSGGAEGFAWLKKILEIDADAVVILITAYGDIDTAVRAIKSGATDFVLKPWQNEKLLATISAAMNLRQSRRKISNLQQKQMRLSADIDQQFGKIVGNCPEMRKVYAIISKVARTDVSVLILGENGTGKELVAREIHRHSRRSGEVFISVDMGAITETLFESELFGHTKGAFTDAREDRAGRFETADGGALFLDEIGNTPMAMQSKLLTVLENRQVIRVGSTIPRNIDIRLISATNQPIHDMVKEGRFRQDLLYRINTIEIHLPPLRERSEDIPVLIEYYLERICSKYQRKIEGISFDAMKILQEYNWPGNIRELRHVIERAIVMSDNNMLTKDDFMPVIRPHTIDGIETDDLNLESIERKVIQKAIRKFHGNVSHAARELGLTRGALYRRMDKHGL